MPTSDDRRLALEELRTADRIVAGTLATLHFLENERRRHERGSSFTEDGSADVDSATSQLAEAQYAFGRALALLGGEQGEWLELEAYRGREGGVRDRPKRSAAELEAMFGVLAASRNVALVETLHHEIRAVFARVRALDSSLGDVAPLADWSDEGEVEQVGAMWTYKSPTVVAIVIVASLLLGLVFGLAG